MSARLSHNKGEIIDPGRQYQILSHIKSGGMGSVYKAIDGFTKTLYAVKECDILDDPRRRNLSRADAVGIFLRESSGIESLKHACVPKGTLLVVPTQLEMCLQCGNQVEGESCPICQLGPSSLFHRPQPVSERYYLLMEYIEGSDLDQLTAQLKRPLAAGCCGKIQGWLNSVAATLDYLHGQGLAHCDLKPENIRIRATDQQLFLLDFGLVRMNSPEGRTKVLPAKTTLRLGTEGYAAPEQAAGNPGFPSDIYAFAMTFVALYSGLDPTNPVDRGPLLSQPMGTLFPRLHQRFQDMLSRSLTGDPQSRPTASQWVDLLEEIPALEAPNMVRLVNKAPEPKNSKLVSGKTKAWLWLAALVFLLTMSLLWLQMKPSDHDLLQATARPMGLIYRHHQDSQIALRLDGGETLKLRDAGAKAKGYWLKVLQVDGKNQKGFIRREHVDIRRTRKKNANPLEGGQP